MKILGKPSKKVNWVMVTYRSTHRRTTLVVKSLSRLKKMTKSVDFSTPPISEKWSVGVILLMTHLRHLKCLIIRVYFTDKTDHNQATKVLVDESLSYEIDY